MLDQKRNLFLVHIPKTGGTSIEKAHGFESDTSKLGRPYVLLRHQNVQEMKKFLRQKGEIEEPVVCCVIRNVYERLQSSYRHLLRFNGEKYDISSQTYSFDAFLETIRRFFENDEVVVRNDRVYLKEQADFPAANMRHIQPLSWWLDGLDSDCVFLRFEALAEDYAQKIAPISGISSLGRQNITPREFADLECAYSDAGARLVYSVYGEEIEQFNMKVVS